MTHACWGAVLCMRLYLQTSILVHCARAVASQHATACDWAGRQAFISQSLIYAGMVGEIARVAGGVFSAAAADNLAGCILSELREGEDASSRRCGS